MGQQRVPAEAVKRTILELESLARTLAELEPALRSVRGFTESIQYYGIDFHVSERFVLADLRPLAFFELMEEIDQDLTTAIERLYDRVMPLLMCQHEWSSHHDREMDGLVDIGGSLMNTALNLYVCKLCTACAATTATLPRVGRGFENPGST